MKIPYILRGVGKGSLLSTAFFIMLSPATFPKAIRVDWENGDDSYDGSSWENVIGTYIGPKQSIPSAIEAASLDDEIWIKQGTYRIKGVQPVGKASKVALVLKNNVGVFGGFTGKEKNLIERSSDASLTIIDGSNAGGNLPAYHVIGMSSLSNSTLDTVTVTGGKADGLATADKCGGGIYCADLSLDCGVFNCIIQENQAEYGGGVFMQKIDSTFRMENCLITANTGNTIGGGVYLSYSSPRMMGCRILGNTSKSTGGGMHAAASSAPKLVECMISGNKAVSGAGINMTDSTGRLYDCIIGANQASSVGGGLHLSNSQPLLTGCTISGNVADIAGGLQLSDSASTFTNCILGANRASNYGGAMHLTNFSSLSLTGCNVHDNAASQAAGGVSLGAISQVQIQNTIFTSNASFAVYEWGPDTDPLLSYCLFYDNPTGDYYDEGAKALTGVDLINDLPEATRNVSGTPLYLMDTPGGLTGQWETLVGFGDTRYLTDKDGAFIPGALVGQFIYPDTENSLQAVIYSNTKDTIEIGGVESLLVSLDGTEYYKLVDHHLTAGSAAIDHGGFTDLSNMDFEGDKRGFDGDALGPETADGSDFDIGFDEYWNPTATPSPTPTPSFTPTPTPSPTPSCSIYVPDDYKTIQEAIDAAQSGCEIVVFPGVYKGILRIRGKDIILRSLYPEIPLIVRNTIIDPDKKNACVIFDGTETENCMLAGFTLTNGRGSSGGGILGQGTLATIAFNIISTNTAYMTDYGKGGGIHNCDGLIHKNIIANNQTTAWNGWGAGLAECDGVIERNIIQNNAAVGGQANCGGLYACHGTIQDNIISYNSSLQQNGTGGGFYYCNGTIQNNVISYNEALFGTALRNCNGDILNNVIYGNVATEYYCGGIAYCDGAITGNIVWANDAPEDPQIVHSSTPSYTCIQGGFQGTGNISLEPRFVNPKGNDFRLEDDSPCIDAGNPDPTYNDRCLPPGRGKYRNDMGAYGGPLNCSMITPLPTPTPGPPPSAKPPRITDALYYDKGGDGVINAGDRVALIFDQGVTLNLSEILDRWFYLPVWGDTLGEKGFQVSESLYNSRQINLLLGNAPHLTIDGIFKMGNQSYNHPSGIDISAELPKGAIVNYYGMAAVDGGEPGINDSGTDIRMLFKIVSKSLSTDGGVLTLADSPDAAFTRHRLKIPPKALAEITQFTLTPPVMGPFVANAIQVISDAVDLQFLPPAMLTLQYLESEVDEDRGQSEASMKMHQLCITGKGTYYWLPVPGKQILDMESNTVTVPLESLNPAGVSTLNKGRLSSSGSYGIFANLPGETMEENAIYLRAASKGIVKLSDVPRLRPGPSGVYQEHEVSFPGYTVTDASDPDHIKVTICPATLLDRMALGGGASFPACSYSLFVIKAQNSSGTPVCFPDAVDMKIQFMDGSKNPYNDVVCFDEGPGQKSCMATVKDLEQGFGVDFDFLDGISQCVYPIEGGGCVECLTVSGLTDNTGKGAWGVVSTPPTPKHLWMLY